MVLESAVVAVWLVVSDETDLRVVARRNLSLIDMALRMLVGERTGHRRLGPAFV